MSSLVTGQLLCDTCWRAHAFVAMWLGANQTLW